jgi:tetratricopeptide (TPR) repeat protein
LALEKFMPSSPPFAGTSRFQIVRRVGAGGMGIVYEAFDRERSTRVALKTLQHFDPTALYRFKQEFRSLADVAHPNLIALYELLSEGEDWFFTMEFVEGTNFLEYVFHEHPQAVKEVSTRTAASAAMTVTATNALSTSSSSDEDDTELVHTHTPADLGRLRPALSQLAGALNVVHAKGKLHRDIKPSNVMVTLEGRVVVLDFGLTFDIHQSGDATSGPAGTLAYMSPEQARGAKLTPATDWYSVGVMLHKALTGRLPFSGPSKEVLQSKVNWRPKRPSSKVEGVPPDLDGLCMDLLETEPEKRPAGAEIVSRLSENPVAALSEISAAPVFVGRTAELAVLRDAFEQVRSGRTAVVLIDGHSGLGKTALVRHFLDEVMRRENTLVVSGRCYEQESVPYKAFDSLIDELGRYLRELDPVTLGQVSPRNPQALAQIFPVLADIPIFVHAGRVPVLDAAELRRRAFAACRDLLARIGDRARLVLSMDDLQWSDPDSAALLTEILRPPDAPAMLLVGTYRTGAGIPRAMLDATAPAPLRRQIELRPLTTEEACELAERLLEDRTAAAKERAAAIARESGGHAYFIHELAHSADESGETPAGEAQLDGVIWRRVSLLPETSRRLLEVIVVSGRPITQEDAYRAAGFEEMTPAILTPLRVGALLRGTGPNRLDLIEPYHDRIRETVVAHLPVEFRRDLHRELARVLESSGRGDADSLARHFDLAQSPEEARRYYVKAAEYATQTVAFDRAVNLYRRALELSGDSGAERRAIQARLADALANAGRGPEAATMYQELAENAEPNAALELRRKAAFQFCISGHLDEGRVVFSRVLRQVALWEPKTPTGTIAALLFNRALLRLRGLRFKERNEADLSDDVLARVEAARAAATSIANIDMIKAIYFNCRGVRLALDAGEPVRIASFVAFEALIRSLSGSRREQTARDLLATARSIAEKHPSSQLQAFLRLCQGATEFQLAYFAQSLKLLLEAEKLMSENAAGMVWEVSTTRLFLVLAWHILGMYRELARRLPELVQDAYQRGDLYAVTGLTSWGMSSVLLGADDPHGARKSVETAMGAWTRTGYHEQHLIACLALGDIDLYEGKAQDAWQRVEREWPLMKDALLFSADLNLIPVTDLRARAALACAAQSGDREKYLRVAERDADSMEKQYLGHAKGLARAVRAGIAMLRGDRNQAVTWLERALAVFGPYQMGAHIAAANARLGRLIEGDLGDQYRNAAEEWARQEEVRNPARLADVHIPFPGCDGTLIR